MRMPDVLEEIEREVRDNQVLIYMKGTPSFPMCGFSAATVRVLNEIGVPFKAVDVLAEPEKREAIKQYSNWPTIPQVYVAGKFIGGGGLRGGKQTQGGGGAPPPGAGGGEEGVGGGAGARARGGRPARGAR